MTSAAITKATSTFQRPGAGAVAEGGMGLREGYRAFAQQRKPVE